MLLSWRVVREAEGTRELLKRAEEKPPPKSGSCLCGVAAPGQDGKTGKAASGPRVRSFPPPGPMADPPGAPWRRRPASLLSRKGRLLGLSGVSFLLGLFPFHFVCLQKDLRVCKTLVL